MENCTAAAEEIDVAHGWSLVMEDCRVSGSGGRGVDCRGKLEATRCIIEGSGSDGVHVNGKDGWDGWDVQLVECTFENNARNVVYVEEGKVKLVECVVRNNGGDGLFV